jgi:hypothetical protein
LESERLTWKNTQEGEGMNIKNPKALPGESVMVKNYRAKDRRESGKVIWAEYKLNGPNNGYWIYTIHLDRVSATGRIITLYRSCDGVEKII